MAVSDLRVHASVTRAPIDPGALLELVAQPGAGAVLSFVGTVRDEKLGRRVLYLDYEAYEPMAERVLHRIGTEMCTRWPACAVALVHRIGRVEIGTASIAIVVSTPHRAEGFEALRYGIETVKRDLPVWKKEYFEDGAVWVQEGS
jgi:molybdopterin synthase catalytic subunit